MGAQKQVDDEFGRYAAVLADSKTLVGVLEVITNDERAVPFFQAMLDKHGIAGRVVVKPWAPGAP